MVRNKIIWKGILVFVGCLTLFYLPYREVRQKTITSFNAEQRALANQAAKRVQAFFDHYQRMAGALAEKKQIVDFDEDGRRLLEEFYTHYQDEISAVTRVDRFGRIVFTFPYDEDAVGRDVSFQPHNRHIIEHHQPVLSEVFTAVQGYRTVALAIPVFREGAYQGSLTILVPFELLAKKYFAEIRPGESGYAWVLSRAGVEIFCQIPGHVGRSVFETSSRFPTIIAMAEKMMAGEEGEAVYFFDRDLTDRIGPVKRHAVYMPVPLPNTYWSIVVATPEKQVLAAMNSFRNSWFFLLVIMLAGAVYYTVFLLRAQERVREEETLRLTAEKISRSEEKYRLLVENTSDLIFIAQDETLRYVNPATEKVLGYSAAEFASMPFVGHIHEEDRYIFLERHRKRVAGEKVPSLHSFRVVSRSGEIIFLQVNSQLTTWEGRPATIHIGRDITVLKRTAMEKEALESQLRQAMKMEAIGTLAGGIAHDFNNILTAIIGFTELALEKVAAGSDVYNDLKDVYKAGLRARDLVSHILLFSRQGGESKGPVEISVIVREGLKLLRATLPATVEINENILAPSGMIYGNPTQIHQVVMNLCTNAWHAMEERGGIIDVTLDRVETGMTGPGAGPPPGRYVHLLVRDNGHGMNAKTLERIYDPYFTTKEVGKGSGMGLAIVHGIVTGLNGFITVDSAPGQGTCFQLFFPVIDQVVEEPEKTLEELPTGTERILFVDDEIAIAALGEKVLGKLGYEVTSCVDSREALRLFQKDPDGYDLVVTDQAMPVLPGSELALLLLKTRPDIPVILCTGFSTIINEEQAKKRGIREFVMKPIVMKEMARIVRKVLDQEQEG